MHSYKCTEVLPPFIPSTYVCMYYAPHNHTVIAEHMVVDICKYKMWAFTIKSSSCSTVPYDAPKSNNLTIRTLGGSKASSLHMLHCIYYAYVVVYIQCMLIMCSDAVLVHAVYVVLYLYYTYVTNLPWQGERLLPITKN